MRLNHLIPSSMISLALLMGASQSVLAGTAAGTGFPLQLKINFGCSVTSPADFDYGTVAEADFKTAFPTKGKIVNLRGSLDNPMSVTCNGSATYFLELSGQHDQALGFNVQKYMWGTKGGGANNKIKYRFVVGGSGNGVGDIKGVSAYSRTLAAAGTDPFTLTTLIDSAWDTNLPIPDTYRDHVTIKVEW